MYIETTAPDSSTTPGPSATPVQLIGRVVGEVDISAHNDEIDCTTSLTDISVNVIMAPTPVMQTESFSPVSANETSSDNTVTVTTVVPVVPAQTISVLGITSGPVSNVSTSSELSVTLASPLVTVSPVIIYQTVSPLQSSITSRNW